MRSNALIVLTLRIAAAVLVTAPASAQIRVRNGGVPSPAAPQLTETLSFTQTANLDDVRAITKFAWSHDGKTGFEVELPIVWRDATFRGTSDDGGGLGDAVLRVQRSLRQDDGVLTSTRWALFGDVRLPTGDDTALEGRVRALPKLLQPGMGSYGVGAGGVCTVIRDRHRFSAALSGRWNAEADDFQMGKEIHAGLSYWYRLRPAVFGADRHLTEVRPVLEALLNHRFESERGGNGTGDDGAVVWLAPGLQVYPSRDLLVQASVALPIVNEIDDVLGRREWSALLALRWYF